MPAGDRADNTAELGHYGSVNILSADRSIPVPVGGVTFGIGSEFIFANKRKL